MLSDPESSAETTRPAGMPAFTIVWMGQLVSLLGTGMTTFAVIFWAWQITGKATVLALIAFFAFFPMLVFSPFAGALVDRWNRKLVMMLADLGAGAGTFIILMLYVMGFLAVWHLYIVAAFVGVFQSFHFPAFSAAITMMIPKKHYARASGMISLAGSLSGIFAPPLAGVLLVLLGISTIFLIDLATVLAAVGTLLFVRIPQPVMTEEGLKTRGSIWKDSVYGFHYIFKRRSLLGLLLVFFLYNLIGTFAYVLLAPMILARTGNDVLALGSVMSSFAIGEVVGGVLLIAWGGPKRRIHGILMTMIFQSLVGVVPLGLGREFVVWAVAAFFASLFSPIANGSSQAIWQSKVPPDVQGRVFAVRRVIAQISGTAAMLLAGPLADFIFEPGMMASGNFAGTFSGIVGTGPGAGIALMFVFAGILGAAVALGAYAFRAVRDIESILPDHDAEAEPQVV